MTSDLLDCADLAGHHTVRFAGRRPGALSAALAGANEASRVRATTRLSALLPDVPHDDRSRLTVTPTLGRMGEGLSSLVPSASVLGAIDALVAEPSRLRLHRRLADGREATDAVAADGSPLSAAAVRRALTEIATLQLHDLDRTIPALADLAQDIERATGASVRIHGFISNGKVPGLGRHIDVGELWIVQLAGTKAWTLWDPSIDFYDSRRPAVGLRTRGEPRSDMLRAGDTLVVPRGTFHRVEPTEELSIGLSIVLDAPSRARLHETFLQHIGDDPAWLEPIHAYPQDTVAFERSLPVPSATDLLSELARFGASVAPRSWGEFGSSHSNAIYRSASGGRAHPVEDLPFLDSVVVAFAGKVLRLRRTFLPTFTKLIAGETVCGDDANDTLDALVRAGVLIGQPTV